jgi:UDP-N-acetylmuramoylalanine--D-glutamate ligase
MKVAVLGYGIEGRVSAQYWRAKGHQVTVCDQESDRDIPPEYGSKLGDGYLHDLEGFDLIVRSPGVHPEAILSANPGSPDLAAKITTNLNEFLNSCPTSHLIAVTGTKGKGTTATLAAKLLETAGRRVYLGGNIGVPPLEFLSKLQPEDYVVLELSSFQLFDVKRSVPTAVCLAVVPEHLNWHADVAEYQAAKANLFRLQTPESRAVYNARSETATAIAGNSPGDKIPYEVPPPGTEPEQKSGAHVSGDHVNYGNTEVAVVSEIALPGRHNLENVCAAIAATWPEIQGELNAARKVLREFRGLEEHLELIAEIDGVKYYNDTYATAPDAAIAAMNAFAADKVMILGGIDKKVPLEDFVDAVVKSNVRGVVLIDDLAAQLADLFAARNYKNAVMGGGTMSGIVAKAHAMAQSGDVVLLSPGCAGNGGMFVDKLDRGHQFNAAVKALR